MFAIYCLLLHPITLYCGHTITGVIFIYTDNANFGVFTIKPFDVLYNNDFERITYARVLLTLYHKSYYGTST